MWLKSLGNKYFLYHSVWRYKAFHNKKQNDNLNLNYTTP